MRAQEFVGEKISPETAQDGFLDQQLVNNGEWTIKATGDTRRYGDTVANVLHVKVFDTKTNEELAWVDFLVKTRREDGERYMESAYTYVNPRYRGKGLAKLMYQYANRLGNDIQPSQMQTDMGKGMWKGLNKAVKQPPSLPTVSVPEKPPSVWQRLRKAMA